MKKTMTVAEARAFFKAEKIFAVGGGFIYNHQGKYRSGLTFVLDAEFELDANGGVVSPLEYVGDKNVTDNFNLDLDGDAEILFGDFWHSQKGAPCFRPKDPAQAKHLLVRVTWGGSCNKHRGYRGDAVKECGALYFRVASSNGGGAGYDYWVLPVGYVRDYDSDQLFRIDHKAAQEQCKRHSTKQAAERAEADKLLREKLAQDAQSRVERERLFSQFQEVKTALDALRGEPVWIPHLDLEDEYFKLECSRFYYSDEGLAQVREALADTHRRIAEYKAKTA